MDKQIIEKIQNQIQVTKKQKIDANLQSVFGSVDFGAFVNEYKLFTSFFGAVPNVIHEIKIDCHQANLVFLNIYEGDIKDFYFNRIYQNYRHSKESSIDQIFYFLYEDLIINFSVFEGHVKFMFRSTPIVKVEEIVELILICKKKIPKISRIYLVRNECDGLQLKPLTLPKIKNDLQSNYNDDFLEVNKIITKRLTTQNDKGLVLLHGKPGTGKTSYIRYLIHKIKKRVIFLPPMMATSITDPGLISILIDNPNSVFVIEDAENIVMDREKKGNSPVSALLNLSDGLLSDCLNIQIICSFNTDISKVDNALMRKGRLIAKYEFKELAIGKAQKLSDKLGFKTNILSPMTLANIYNQSAADFQNTSNYQPIGFVRSQIV